LNHKVNTGRYYIVCLNSVSTILHFMCVGWSVQLLDAGSVRFA